MTGLLSQLSVTQITYKYKDKDQYRILLVKTETYRRNTVNLMGG